MSISENEFYIGHCQAKSRVEGSASWTLEISKRQEFIGPMNSTEEVIMWQKNVTFVNLYMNFEKTPSQVAMEMKDSQLNTLLSNGTGIPSDHLL